LAFPVFMGIFKPIDVTSPIMTVRPADNRAVRDAAAYSRRAVLARTRHG
jgi:hypothetical protein